MHLRRSAWPPGASGRAPRYASIRWTWQYALSKIVRNMISRLTFLDKAQASGASPLQHRAMPPPALVAARLVARLTRREPGRMVSVTWPTRPAPSGATTKEQPNADSLHRTRRRRRRLRHATRRGGAGPGRGLPAGGRLAHPSRGGSSSGSSAAGPDQAARDAARGGPARGRRRAGRTGRGPARGAPHLRAGHLGHRHRRRRPHLRLQPRRADGDGLRPRRQARARGRRARHARRAGGRGLAALGRGSTGTATCGWSSA